jgi:hypothetical protein
MKQMAAMIFLALGVAMTMSLAHAQSNSKQATDAASKHRSEQATEKNQPKKPVSKPAAGGSVAKQLAACKNNASWNVIKREQCVWNLCKGRWGRDGCPPEAKARPAGT